VESVEEAGGFPRWARVSTHLILAGLLAAAAWWKLPRPAYVESPEAITFNLTAMNFVSAGIMITHTSKTTGSIFLEIYTTSNTQISGRITSPVDEPIAISEGGATSKHERCEAGIVNITPTPYYGCQTFQYSITPFGNTSGGAGWDANGMTLEASLSAVSVTTNIFNTHQQVTTIYENVKHAPDYDWSAVALAQINNPSIVIPQPLSLSTRAEGLVTLVTNSSTISIGNPPALQRESEWTLGVGALVGAAGGAAVAAIGIAIEPSWRRYLYTEEQSRSRRQEKQNNRARDRRR
jgi:hypothetical protein